MRRQHGCDENNRARMQDRSVLDRPRQKPIVPSALAGHTTRFAPSFRFCLAPKCAVSGLCRMPIIPETHAGSYWDASDLLSHAGQKYSFNPNWICLPVAEDALSFPKLGFPIVSGALLAAGRKKAGVLVRLNASVRNCRLRRSRNAKFLNIEKSRFRVDGPRPARRARFPNNVSGLPAAFSTCPGCENAAGLNQPSGPEFGR